MAPHTGSPTTRVGELRKEGQGEQIASAQCQSRGDTCAEISKGTRQRSNYVHYGSVLKTTPPRRCFRDQRPRSNDPPNMEPGCCSSRRPWASVSTASPDRCAWLPTRTGSRRAGGVAV